MCEKHNDMILAFYDRPGSPPVSVGRVNRARKNEWQPRPRKVRNVRSAIPGASITSNCTEEERQNAA